MGSVTSINPTIELKRFFNFMYGDLQGYVYSPTKDLESGNFEQYFFEWPVEQDMLIEHCLRNTVTREVYYGPALYNSRNAEKDGFLGTYFIWAEFDGKLPNSDKLKDIPEPNLKIQSSDEAHQHWYWQLDQFQDNQELLENVTQRLAYHLEADLGCWNSNRVLRPPDTTHHESGRQVTILRQDLRTTPINLFEGLPELPIKLLREDDIKFVPDPLDVIAKYKWDDENFKFFKTKVIPKGQRSSALTKIAHICMEMGMTNSETLALLLNRDSAWGKFSKRLDRKVRLLGIINYCRSRHPAVDEQKESRLKVFSYDEFMQSEIKIEWVVPNFIHKKGILSISGPPGVGKSTFSLRFAEKMAKGKQFLNWEPSRPIRTLFISMEMPHEELQYFLNQMKFEASDLLKENFLLLPLGSSIGLTNKVSQAELEIAIDRFQPDGVIFDSLGKSTGDDINDKKIISGVFDYIDRIRAIYGVFSWLIHHPRKGQVGNKKPNRLDDLYGNVYIGANITTAVSLWPAGNFIEVDCLKLRTAPEFPSFRIKRTPQIDFELVDTKPTITKDTPIFGSSTVDLDGTL